jgi:serine/threonine-protein kinase RsbW
LEQTFRIANRSNEVPDVLSGVEEFCRIHGFGKETAGDLRLVAEEVLTNIVKYAHDPGVEHAVELRLSASPQSVRMEFRDEGTPFNPLVQPAPELNVGTGTRAIGGLGLHLIRALIDDASYSREETVNVLVLIKRVGSAV